MRSVRAYLFNRGEFIFPEKKTPVAYHNFWGLVHGLILKGEKIEINEGTGNMDIGGDEIYEKDLVEVSIVNERGKTTAKEVGTVQYEDGCYTVFNGEGFLEDVGSFSEEDMRIIGHEYEGELNYEE